MSEHELIIAKGMQSGSSMGKSTILSIPPAPIKKEYLQAIEAMRQKHKRRGGI